MKKDLSKSPENPCESSAFWGGATLKQIRETLNLPKKCKTAFTLAETIILPCKNYNFSFSDYYFSKNHNLRPFKKTFAAFDMKQAAFTLAETMIVLVILGVIATLTVPNLINKQKEATQRTKVKKAMAMYESVVNKMILENDRSFNGLNVAGCDKTVSYFKYIKRDTNNGCRFQTSDKLWWDVTNIQRPLIAFKEEDLTKEIANAKDNERAYVMVGRFDNDGNLRVNDLAYEQKNLIIDEDGNNSYVQVAKLYGNISEFMSKCTIVSETRCKIDGTRKYFYKITYTDESVTHEGVNNSAYWRSLCVYDRDAKPPTKTCNETSKTNAGDVAYYYEDQFGVNVYTLRDSADNSICTASRCKDDGDYYEAAKSKCTNGTRLATPAEMQSLYNQGKLRQNRHYWTGVEAGTDNAYTFYTGNGGLVNSTTKYSNGVIYSVCVGN